MTTIPPGRPGPADSDVLVRTGTPAGTRGRDAETSDRRWNERSEASRNPNGGPRFRLGSASLEQRWAPRRYGRASLPEPKPASRAITMSALRSGAPSFVMIA